MKNRHSTVNCNHYSYEIADTERWFNFPQKEESSLLLQAKTVVILAVELWLQKTNVTSNSHYWITSVALHLCYEAQFHLLVLIKWSYGAKFYFVYKKHNLYKECTFSDFYRTYEKNGFFPIFNFNTSSVHNKGSGRKTTTTLYLSKSSNITLWKYSISRKSPTVKVKVLRI